MTKSYKKNLPAPALAASPVVTGGRGALLPLGMMVAGLFVGSQSVQAEEQTLPAVTVKANAEQQDGYRATKKRVEKVTQEPYDVAQAVATITCSLMEERDANPLRGAMRTVSGLCFNAAEGGRSGDNMM